MSTKKRFWPNVKVPADALTSELWRQWSARPHHAYWLASDPVFARAAVASLFERLTGQPATLPDFVVWPTGQLVLEVSQQLAAWSLRRPAVAPFRFFVLELQNAELEAQNALLKTLEEAPITSRFFFISARSNLFLPTVVSRLCCLTRPASTVDSTAAERFCQSSSGERLALVGEWLEAGPEVVELSLRALEQWWSNHGPARSSEVFLIGGRALARARRDLAQRGLPDRLALEILALTFPSL